jgi:hypothetical protein
MTPKAASSELAGSGTTDTPKLLILKSMLLLSELLISSASKPTLAQILRSPQDGYQIQRSRSPRHAHGPVGGSRAPRPPPYADTPEKVVETG